MLSFGYIGLLSCIIIADNAGLLCPRTPTPTRGVSSHCIGIVANLRSPPDTNRNEGISSPRTTWYKKKEQHRVSLIVVDFRASDRPSVRRDLLLDHSLLRRRRVARGLDLGNSILGVDRLDRPLAGEVEVDVLEGANERRTALVQRE